MDKLRPSIIGASLAITTALAYAACALLFFLFPGMGMAFVQSLFHGLDFSKLTVTPGVFDFAGFGRVAVALAAYGFFVGALFAIVRNRFTS